VAKRRLEERQQGKPDSQPADGGPELPELWGFGASPIGAGKWLAYRLSSRGSVVVLTPTRQGKHAGEAKHNAVARAQAAWSRMVARGTP